MPLAQACAPATDSELKALLQSLNSGAHAAAFSASNTQAYPQHADGQSRRRKDVKTVTCSGVAHEQPRPLKAPNEGNLVGYYYSPLSPSPSSKPTKITKRSSKPKADHSTSEAEIVSFGKSYALMVHQGRRPNLAFTLNLRPHKKYIEGKQEQSSLREAILQSLDYIFKSVTGAPMPAIHAYENTKGGHGIHVHFLAYCPPDKYHKLVLQIRSAFSKSYADEINKLLVRHAAQMNALGIRKSRANAPIPAKYDALLQLRSAIKSQANASLPVGVSDGEPEAVVRKRLFLPFWVSSPDAPLNEASSLKELRYLTKSADPTITCEYQGKLCTLEELSRDGKLLGGDGFKLERQAPRFAHANLASSRCVGPGARAADPTFQPPKNVFAELLIPGLTSIELRKKAQQAVLGFGLADTLRAQAAASAQRAATEAAHASCKAALLQVQAKAESRHAMLQALQAMLQDSPCDRAPASNHQAANPDLAAGATTRRKAELQPITMKIPTEEDVQHRENSASVL